MRIPWHSLQWSQRLLARPYFPAACNPCLLTHWPLANPLAAHPQLVVALLAALHDRLDAASAADVAGFVWGLRFVSVPYSRTLARMQMRCAVSGCQPPCRHVHTQSAAGRSCLWMMRPVHGLGAPARLLTTLAYKCQSAVREGFT